MESRVKKIIVSILLMFVFGASLIIFASCGDDISKARIEVEKTSYEISLGEGVDNTVTFRAGISGTSGSLYYSVKNDGIIKVTLTPYTIDVYDVKVEAVNAGESSIVLFLGENSAINKEVKITVVQNITALSLSSDYEYYVKRGETTVLNLGADLQVLPRNASVSKIKYKIVGNPDNLDVSINERGVLDATRCLSNGRIVVSAYASDSVSVEFDVYIVTAVNKTDIALTSKFANERNVTSLYRNGYQYEDKIELIKTGSGGLATPYIDYYNEVTIGFEGNDTFSEYFVAYMIQGTSCQTTFANGSWITLTENSFKIQSVELGTSILKFRINRKGAENFFDDIEVEFSVHTIDVPIALSVTDPTSDTSGMVMKIEDEADYSVALFNSYAEGSYGQPIMFNVTPSSVGPEQSEIVIDLTNLAEGIKFYDDHGILLNNSDRLRDITVLAGQVLYVRGSTLGYVYDPTCVLNVYSKFSNRFVNVGGERVGITVKFTIYEGITSFDIASGKDEYYLDLTSNIDNQAEIELTTGNVNSYSKWISYEVEDDSLVEVIKDISNDLRYTIKAKEDKEGSTFVTFHSGNNFTITITVHNFYPINSVKILVPSIFENGYIGYVNTKEDDSSIVEEIAVQVGGQFTFDVLVNNGDFGTVSKFTYALSPYAIGDNVGMVSKNDNTRTITIKSEGKVRLTVNAYGYTKDGEQLASSGEVASAVIIIVGYVPIKTIELSASSIVLIDPSTIAYNKISQYSLATLNANIYPQNASLMGFGDIINEEGDRGDARITWRANFNGAEEACYMSGGQQYIIKNGVKRYIEVRNSRYYIDSVAPENELVYHLNENTVTDSGNNSYYLYSENVGPYITISANAINSADMDVVTFTIEASIYLSKFNRSYSAICTVRVQKAVQVTNIYVDNLAYSQVNFDSRRGLGESTSNTFRLSTRVVPSNAFDTSLRYDLVSSISTNGDNRPVFTVKDGVIIPLNGGVGILRIAPQDSFRNATTLNEDVARYITVVVQDGRTKQTAYSVSNAEELARIGNASDNVANLSYYYYLANDIDISSIRNWSPIGTAGHQFTGYLSGAELNFVTIREGENVTSQIVEGTKHKIFGLRLTNIGQGDNYIGLFGYISSGATIENVNVEVAEVNIDASASTGALYFGTLVGCAMGTTCELKTHPDYSGYYYYECLTYPQMLNCSIYFKNSINIRASKGKTYIGGLCGYMYNAYLKNTNNYAVNIDALNVTYVADSTETICVGGLVGYATEDIAKVSYTNGVSTEYADMAIFSSAISTSGDKCSMLQCSNAYSYADIQDDIAVTYIPANVLTGYSVYVRNINVSNEGSDNINNSYIGGVVGSLQRHNTGNENVSLYMYWVENSLRDISCFAQINAENFDNVGGIAGASSAGIRNVYFDGNVLGYNNVGGIIGNGRASIHIARIYVYNKQNVVVGNSCVGGVIGLFEDTATYHYIAYASISGVDKQNAVCGVNNVASMIGKATSLAILYCYDNVYAVNTNAEKCNVVNSVNDVLFSYSFTHNVLPTSNFTITNSYKVNEGGTVAYMQDNSTTYANVNEFMGNSEVQDRFVLPYTLGSEYASINDGLPIIKAITSSSSYLYLFEVISSEIKLTFNNSSRAIAVRNDDNGNISEILLFYYELDEAFAQTLSNTLRNKINKQLQLNNTYNLDELFNFSLMPKPFTSYVVYVSVVGAGAGFSATLNQNAQLVLQSSGAFVLKFVSKQNPNLVANVKVNVINYVSSYNMYMSDSLDSNVYGVNNDISFRKGTTFEGYVKAQNVLEVEGVMCTLLASDNFNLTINVNSSNNTYYSLKTQDEVNISGNTFESEVYALSIKDTDCNIIEIKSTEDTTVTDNDNYKMYSYTQLTTIAVIAYSKDLAISTALNTKTYYSLELNGVVFSADLRIGADILVWSVDNVYNPNNKTIEILANGVIKVDGVIYVPINIINETNIKNSLYARVSVLTSTINTNYTLYANEIQEYICAKLVGYDMAIDEASIVSITAPNVTSGVMTIIPNIALSGEQVDLNITQIHPIIVNYNVYQGATSVNCNLLSAEYAPTDSINFDVVLVSDVSNSSIEGITYVVEAIDENGEVLNDGTEEQLVVFYELRESKAGANNQTIYFFATNVMLKDEYASRYLSSNKMYRITFKSKTIESISSSVIITFVPQIVQRLDMIFYNALKLTNEVTGGIGFKLTDANIASSYINPGTSGLIVIDMYPAYAYFDELELSSDINGDIFIEFDQMIEVSSREYIFSPYTNIITENGAKIQLSCLNDYLGAFKGKIYVKTYLNSNATPGAIYTLTLSAKSKNDKGELITTLSKSIRLETTSTPTAVVQNQNGINKISGLNDAEESVVRNYVVAGNYFSFDVVVSNIDGLTEDAINADGTDSCLVMDESINSADLVNHDYLLSTTRYTRVSKVEKDGKITYTYRVFVGPDIEEGTVINFTWKHSYIEDGKEHMLEIDVYDVYVTKYLIDSINLSVPFSAYSNQVQMALYEAKNISVASISLLTMVDSVVLLPIDISEDTAQLFNLMNNLGGVYTSQKDDYGKMFSPVALVREYDSRLKKYYYSLDGETVNIEFDELTNTFTLVLSDAEDSIWLYDSNGFVIRRENPSIKYSFKLGTKLISNVLQSYLNEKYFGTKTNILSPNNRTFLMLQTSGEEEFKSLSTSSEGVSLKVATIVDKMGVIFIPTKRSSNNILRINYTYVVSGTYAVDYSRDFVITIVSASSTDLPTEVDSQESFENMSVGEYYILTGDITLVNYTPVQANMASLDGNGYTINIASFSQAALEAANVNLGLFTNVNSGTILKNITVNIGYLGTLDLVNAVQVNVGFFAQNNAGVITNCAVVAEGSSGDFVNNNNMALNEVSIWETTGAANRTITILTPSSITNVPQISLFVTTNSGSITHSRVMNKTSADYVTKATMLTLKAKGQVSGFAVNNSGAIASCYVSNISIINTHDVVKDNKTSGFVITNNGRIIQSFVCNPYKNSKIRSDVGYLSSNGVVTGFVYANQNEIRDCYASIPLMSNASVSGFVYNNTRDGTIENAYSSCLVKSNSAVHMPFVGVSSVGDVLDESIEGLSNVYYLGTEYSAYSYVVDDSYPATEISYNKFGKDTSFGGFSFGTDDDDEYSGASNESVWYLNSTVGPRITSAERIAASQQIIMTDDDGVKYLIYTKDDTNAGELGTKENPIVILNANDFKELFMNNAVVVDTNSNAMIVADVYVRLANDINFDDINGEIPTSSIGLMHCNIEGNGFTLKNIVLSNSGNTSNEIDTLGLFSYINSCNIRNLNLEIKQANCENVKLLGGLAGAIINSKVSSISINSNAVISARYVAGGLAGGIFGASSLSGIKSQVSVNINYKPSVSVNTPTTYTQGVIDGSFNTISVLDSKGKTTTYPTTIKNIDKISNISYAGGIAGIIDTMLVKNQNSTTISANNITTEYTARMTMGGENMNNLTTYGAGSLSAQFVGGITGFLGAYSHIANATYELLYNDTENKQYFDTEYCAGGLVAVNSGMLSRSAVKYNRQYESTVEKDIYTYTSSGVDVRKGKTNLFKGELWIAGGIVGINNLGTVAHCLSLCDVVDKATNASNITEQYLGGAIGWSYLGRIDTIYTTGNVYSNRNINAKYVGGVVGRYTTIQASVVVETDIGNNSNGDINSAIDEIAPKFNNVFALNLWDKQTVREQFASGHAGIIIGRVNVVGSAKGIISKDAYYMPDLTIGTTSYSDALQDNGKPIIIGYCEDADNWCPATPNVYTLLVNEKGGGVDINLNGVKYKNFYDDEKSSQLYDFFAPFENQSDIWTVQEKTLPKIKYSAFTNEEYIADLFTYLHAIDKVSYKTLILQDDIDFDLNNYWLAESSENVYNVYYALTHNGITYNIDIGVHYYTSLPTRFDTNLGAGMNAEGFAIDSGTAISQAINIYKIDDYDKKVGSWDPCDVFGSVIEGGNNVPKVSATITSGNKYKFTNTLNIATYNTKTFSGKLQSNRDLSVPIEFKNINLTGTNGLFAQTRKVSISNFKFTFTSCNFANKDNVGLISAMDYASTFTNVQVVYNGTISYQGHTFGGFVGTSSGTTVLSNCTINMKLNRSPKDDSEKEIANKNIGGFIGSGNSILLTNCQADIDINASFRNDFTNQYQGSYLSYVGGFIGFAQSVQINSCNVNPKTSFTAITVTNKDTTRDGNILYVGGAVGYIYTSGLIDSFVMSGDIKLNDMMYVDAGFVAGFAQNTSIRDSNIGSISLNRALTVTSALGSSLTGSNDANEGLRLGGLVGYNKVTRLSSNFIAYDCKVYVDIDVQSLKKLGQDSQTDTFGVGGLYGALEATTMNNYYINKNVVNGSINVNYAENNVNQYMYVGGLVGRNVLTNTQSNNNIGKVVYDKDALYMDIIIKGSSASNRATIFAGGFVGGNTDGGQNFYGAMYLNQCFIAGVVDISGIVATNGSYLGGIGGTLYGTVVASTIVATSLYPGANLGKGYNAGDFDMGAVCGNYDEKNKLDIDTNNSKLYDNQDSLYYYIALNKDKLSEQQASKAQMFGIYVIEELVGIDFNNSANTGEISKYTLRSYADFVSDYRTFTNYKEETNLNTVFGMIVNDYGLLNINCYNLFNPTSSTLSALGSSSRYVKLSNGGSVSSSVTISSSTRVIDLGKKEITITNRSLFNSIPANVIVSNANFKLNNASAYALSSGTTAGVILGVYASGTATKATNTALIASNFAGVMSDVMLDVQSTVANDGNFAFIANSASSAYLFNVQILGSAQVGDGYSDSGASIHILANSSTNTNNYAHTIMFACNIVSQTNLAVALNDSKYSNLKYDALSCLVSGSGAKDIYVCGYNGSSSYQNYGKASVMQILVDRWSGNSSYKAPLPKDTEDINYGHEYLTRWAEQVNTGIEKVGDVTYKLVNNYSRLMWAWNNKYNIKLLSSLNRSSKENKGNYYFNSANDFTGTINGNSKGLYGIKLYESTKAGMFVSSGSNILTNCTFTNITFGFADLYGYFGDVTINPITDLEEVTNKKYNDTGFVGVLAKEANNVKLSNVTIKYTGDQANSMLYARGVGGVFGKSYSNSFENVEVNNMIVVAFDCDNYNADNAGTAGGICAQSNNDTFKNCSIDNCTIVSGNGHSAQGAIGGSGSDRYNGKSGRDAGAVGGICATAKQSTFTNISVRNHTSIISGDAGNGGQGTNSGSIYTGQNISSLIGIGGSGGNCYIGGIVGIGDNCTISGSNSIDVSSFKTKNNTNFTRLDHRTGNVCAGTGGIGGNGLRGRNHGDSGLVDFDERWGDDYDCPRIHEGSKGGTGGHGGYTFVGKLTGRNGTSTYKNTGTTCDINCGAGGTGGVGGKGGNGDDWDVVVLHFYHYAKKGGAGGTGGTNGNNQSGSSGSAGNSRVNWETGGAGGAGGAGAPSTACYLQS